MAQDVHWTQAARDAIANSERWAEKLPATELAQTSALIAIAHLLTGVNEHLREIKGEVATLAASIETIQGDTARIAGS